MSVTRYQRETPQGPVVVEARPVLNWQNGGKDPESVSRSISATQALATWCGGEADLSDPLHLGIHVATPHGSVRAESGDWIVKEENGDYRVLTNSDFHHTYKPIVAQEDVVAKRERLTNELLEIASDYGTAEQQKIEEVASILSLPPGGAP